MARTSAFTTAMLLFAAAGPLASASRITQYEARQAAATPTATSMTAVTSCHKHRTQVWCEYGTTEYQVSMATVPATLPTAYTSCHPHDTTMYCVDPSGDDVEVLGYTAAAQTTGAAGGSTDDSTTAEGSSGGGNVHCHEHSGVEHCVGGSGEEPVSCDAKDREYNIGLRIGMIFVVLVTSLIGVLGPIFVAPVLPAKAQIVLTVLKQFGTGVIISTALIHLFTHAELMFSNQCVGPLLYEGTTAAVVMAGIFIAWIVEYGSHRAARKFFSNSTYNDEVVSVMVLEAGIIFHSILIGITVVVASDQYFAGLLAVIVFHQMFEGIALGSRIAAVGHTVRNLAAAHTHAHSLPTGTDQKNANEVDGGVVSERSSGPSASSTGWKALSMPKKLIMGVGFAVTTPIGMAIGTGVINTFNGADKRTLIALGTLDAVSAGILLWVGLIDMWAADWMFGGELAEAGLGTTLSAGLALVLGLVLMSVLGKWA